jgi:prepilin-type N-terminal cleavage/methylation domain-containing protein
MRRKGFTLVELLVVIAIIALLMGILMPALAQVKRLAQRIMCGTNLSSIGKAMLVYSGDNEEDFPRAGGNMSLWSNNGGGAKGKIYRWDAKATSSQTAQHRAFNGTRKAQATITSCFYLLIKYTDGTPKQFNCGGDLEAAIFKMSDVTPTASPPLTDMADAWDFGGHGTDDRWPGEYVSYSYHMPFNHSNPGSDNTNCKALTSSSSAASPLAADRNPFLDKNALNVYVTNTGTPVITEETQPGWMSRKFSDPDKVWNSAAHQREGQNVLYADAHVDFERLCNAGIENDNLWRCWKSNLAAGQEGDNEKRQVGESGSIPTTIGGATFGPWSEEDAFLVNEYNGDPI